MGLAALRKILEPMPFDPSALDGETVVVDADNLVWAFATAIGQGEPPRGPDGRSVAHVIGLVNRLRLYATWNVRSAWVFDGEQPALKAATLAGRETRQEAMGETWVTARELDECKDVLAALGVPWMVAPGEGDAQCARLVRDGGAFAAVTQDYDAALHGTPLTLRNLAASRTRKPECIRLEEALSAAGLSRAQLVDVAILIGTDYNAGVKGVGPVKAVKLVQKHGDVHGALQALDATMAEAEEVRRLFLDHPVDAAWRPAWRAPDAQASVAAMRRFGLGEDRARKVAEACAALVA